ncbi:hypothetical protein F3Y22_tig00003041pilonHSYRG01077 [Hibiscus syriacus]|uniref:CCHC-type domain-containing protein n=1 Tax=Hibiscus syriacus TaxID=106335 RepID=A0A6A3CSL5_HIBSY|nr:hypothetical protein F3Y22_tig00003041pilonHSYRG01077 [Hibiscus syriacus]
MKKKEFSDNSFPHPTNDSMRAYLIKVKEVCDALASCGSEVSQAVHMTSILKGFGESLEPFPMSANMAQGKISRGFEEQADSRSSPRQTYSRGRSAGRGRGRARLQCQLCGKNGHLVDRCVHRFDENFPGVTANDNSYSRDDSSAAYYSVNNTKSTGCATHHVTSDGVNINQSVDLDNPEQNGVVERKHRHVIELALVLLAQASLPFKFWAYAVVTAVHLINRLPTRVLEGISPFENTSLNFGLNPFSFAKLHEKVSNEYSTHASSSSLQIVADVHKFQHVLAEGYDNNSMINNSPTIVSSNDSSSNVAATSNSQNEAQEDVVDSSSATQDNATHEETVVPQSVNECTPSEDDNSDMPTNTHHMISRSKCGVFKPKVYVSSIVDEVPRDVYEALTSPRYKAKLVAKGYSQVPGYDFKDTYSPVIKFYTLNIVLSIVVTSKWCIRHVDVNNAFLNGYRIYILVYVDDIIITGESSPSIDSVVHALSRNFSLKDLGSLAYFLGIEVKCTEEALLLSQRKYILELLEKTGLLNATPTVTPMIGASKMTQEAGALLNDAREYRSIVGALLYVCHTRPDIAFSVNKAAQFMHAPRELHLTAVKRILKYLAGNLNYSLTFSSNGVSQDVVAFADVDWGDSLDDRRSVSSHAVFFCHCPVTWCSKKHKIVSRSTMEAEYRSVADATAKVTWMSSLLCELGIKHRNMLVVWCDNTSTMALSTNPVYHSQSKHIDMDVHFVREKVAANQLQVNYVPASHQFQYQMSRNLAAILGGAEGAVALVVIVGLFIRFCLFYKRGVLRTFETGSSDPSIQGFDDFSEEETDPACNDFDIGQYPNFDDETAVAEEVVVDDNEEEVTTGSPEASFAQLPAYCHNLKLKNPGSVTHIKTDRDGRFELLFIAIGAAIRSFINCMRPVIIVDGAHLKGRYLGVNLLAVAMDANNGILPIAYEVGKSETSDSWTWFMGHLRDCIGPISNLTIIYDRANSIDNAVRRCFPDAFHGLCGVHLYRNLKSRNMEHRVTPWTEKKITKRVVKSMSWRVEPCSNTLFETYGEIVYPIPHPYEWDIPDDSRKVVIQG